MPGDFATILLGAQEGGEASFARLYELTNPALVRYLRVVSDVDPANLALTTWTTLLRRLPSSPADENAWLELTVGVARLSVEDARQRETWSHLVDPTVHLPFTALADLEAAGPAEGPDSAAGTGAHPSAPRDSGAGPEVASPDEVTDGVDRTIAALRSLPPAEADVLAMRATAWLDREAICRLTGRDAAGVRAVLDQGLEHVGLPLFTLVKALRAPARPDELADLPVVLHLFANGAVERGGAAVAATAASVAAVGTVSQPSVVNLLDVPAVAPGSRTAHPSGGSAAGRASRLGWVGATAAAAALAVGGVGAAAWNGLLPDLFGGSGTTRAPSAEGPTRTGQPTGGDADQPRQPTTGQQQPGTPRPRTPAVSVRAPGATQAQTGARPGTVSLGTVELAVQVVSVSSLVGGSGTVVAGVALPAPSGPADGAVASPSTPGSSAPASPATPAPRPATQPSRAVSPSEQAHAQRKGQARTQLRAQMNTKAHGHAKAKAKAKAKGHVKAKSHTHAKAKSHAKGHGHAKAKAHGHAHAHAKHGGGKRTAQA